MKLLNELEALGYSFWLEDDLIKFKHTGPGEPDAKIVKPLFDELKKCKKEAVKHLKGRQASRITALLKEKGLIKIYSRVLGEHVYFARDKKAAAKVKDAVVYTLPELRQLVLSNTDAEQLRRVHKAKKLFGGELVAKGDIKWKQKRSKA